MVMVVLTLPMGTKVHRKVVIFVLTITTMDTPLKNVTNCMVIPLVTDKDRRLSKTVLKEQW